MPVLGTRILKILLRNSGTEKLLQALFNGDNLSEIAWEEFLKRYSKLILKVCWKFDKDYDKVMQQYLFTCEKLADNNFSLLKKYNSDFNRDKPKFSTWLAVVARNICIDNYRKKSGRKRYPAAVENLSEEDKSIFELYYWKGLSLREITETLNLHLPGRIETVNQKLDRINSLLSRSPGIRDQIHLVPYNDQAIGKEDEMDENNYDEKIAKWVSGLPDIEKIVIRLRFWEGLSAREISEICRITPYNKVYSILNKSLKLLREMSEEERNI